MQLLILLSPGRMPRDGGPGLSLTNSNISAKTESSFNNINKEPNKVYRKNWGLLFKVSAAPFHNWAPLHRITFPCAGSVLASYYQHGIYPSH
jgi:hypothetical protein